MKGLTAISFDSFSGRGFMSKFILIESHRKPDLQSARGQLRLAARACPVYRVDGRPIWQLLLINTRICPASNRF